MEITWRLNKKKSSERYKHYEAIEIKPCCGDTAKALQDSVIKFGEYESWPFNTENTLNIFRCYPYPEGACWNSYPINYCPFCGAKVTLIEEGVVPKVQLLAKRRQK